jgi:hypothetical protein
MALDRIAVMEVDAKAARGVDCLNGKYLGIIPHGINLNRLPSLFERIKGERKGKASLGEMCSRF